jgi:hypothetical protein
MITPELFHDAKLKIKRANQHIQELQMRLSAFLNTDFYRLHVEEEAKTGRHVLKFEQTNPLPEDIPLIIGDAMHNLRTVLDYVAFEIVTEAGGPTDYVKFPVREDRDKLKAALTGGEMKVAAPDIIDLILDVVQPYPGGNGAALHVLHSLDVGDKHYKLTPVISVAALTDVTGQAGGITFSKCTFGVGQGGKLNVVGMPGKFTFEGHGQPTFAVLFGKGQPFQGQPVIPTLQQLSQLVAGTVQAIEQVCLARRARTQGSSHAAPAAGSHPPET